MDSQRANAWVGQPWGGLWGRTYSDAGRLAVRPRRGPAARTEPLGWSDEQDPRRNNLDLLRFVFAALVVLSHSYSMTLPQPQWVREPLLGLTGRQVSLGTLSVYGFFAISGFLIAKSWARSRSFGEFLGKRALRLYPGFAAMTLVCVFVAVPLATGALPGVDLKFLGKLAYRVLVFDAWEDPAAFAGQQTTAINASAWTIPYEFWCYVALAAVASAGALRRRWWAVGLLAAAYGLHQAFAVWNCGPVWAQVLPRELASHVTRVVGVPAKWPEFLTYFFAGMVFATWRDRIPHSAKLAAACAGVLVASAAVRPLMQFALPVCGVYLLFWVALHPRLRTENFGRRGDFSYGIYLYAFPIQQLIIKWVGPADVQPLQLFALSMPLSLAAGVLSWHGVEKWFVHRKRTAAAPAAAMTPTTATEWAESTGGGTAAVETVEAMEERPPIRISPATTPYAAAA